MNTQITDFGPPAYYDLNLDGSTQMATFDTGVFTSVSVQLVELNTPGGAYVVTFYRSNDGVTPCALETPQTLADNGMTPKIDANGFRYLHAQVTTPNTGKVRLFAVAKGD